MITSTLSANERETIYLLASGYTILQAAAKLDRSSESINLYIKSAKKKLNANSRDQLIALAVAGDLI